MKAVQLVRTRITYSETAFAELVLWRLAKPVAGSAHAFKYRLAYVARGVSVLRYDNEAGKGDHRHYRLIEIQYEFSSLAKMLLDFELDVKKERGEKE